MAPLFYKHTLALFFEGPSLTKEIINGLHSKLRDSKYKTLDEAIGSLVELP